MKTLIIGNQGYIGPILVKFIKQNYNNSWVGGFDNSYFANENIPGGFPDRYLDIQYFGDVREFPFKILKRFDSVIYLAAISNDPMGEQFKNQTLQINQNSAVKIAEASSKSDIENFVFASSCSVYGTNSSNPRTEKSDLNPLTSYAKSKVGTEKLLERISSKNKNITCLRFATACGFSPRLRLDLVLNDFVASAVVNKKIQILSNGLPWRPLIHIKDMSRALVWGANRDSSHGNFLTLNTGSNAWNYKIKDLAQAVKNKFENIEVEINQNAEPDKRSYKVDFSLFSKLAPQFTPKVNLDMAIDDLKTGLSKINFRDANFRESKYIRLEILKRHIIGERLNNDLKWIN